MTTENNNLSNTTPNIEVSLCIHFKDKVMTRRVKLNKNWHSQITSDPWTEILSQYLLNKHETSSPQISKECLGLQLNKSSQMRVGKILNALGWKRKTVRRGFKVMSIWVKENPNLPSHIF